MTKDEDTKLYVDHFRDPIVDVRPFFESANETQRLNPGHSRGTLSEGTKYFNIGMKLSLIHI